MDALSGLKAAWHVGRIADMRAGKDIVPTHVQLIISDLCNQNCHFCAYRMDGGFATERFADEDGNRNPNRFIPTGKAIEILDDCKAVGVQAVQFTGGGEPTVHKDWQQIIGHAQSLGLETGLVTNGVRLKSCGAVDNLTWVRISLDAGKEATYKAIRQSSAWRQALEAIKLAGTLEATSGVGFVVTSENWKEIVRACRIARDAGVGYVRLSAMFGTGGTDEYLGIEGFVANQIRKAKQLETDTFKVIDFWRNRMDDLVQGSPDYSFCGYQQFTTYIGGDLKVYTCCTNAYTAHGECGDLNDMTFKQWCETKRQIMFDARNCHHCQFNDKNRIINYLIQPKPAHVGFV